MYFTYVPVIPIILVVFALVIFWIFWKWMKANKAGLPVEDEMSKKTWQKAGFCAWLVSIYAILGSRIVGEKVAEAAGDCTLVGTYMMVGGLVVPTLTFFVLYFWFSRKGSV